MNTISRTISGVVAVFLGMVLIVFPFFLSDKGIFFTWIYGIPIFIIGVFILFNKNEDKIEQIIQLVKGDKLLQFKKLKEDKLLQFKKLKGGKKKK